MLEMEAKQKHRNWGNSLFNDCMLFIFIGSGCFLVCVSSLKFWSHHRDYNFASPCEDVEDNALVHKQAFDVH